MLKRLLFALAFANLALLLSVGTATAAEAAPAVVTASHCSALNGDNVACTDPKCDSIRTAGDWGKDAGKCGSDAPPTTAPSTSAISEVTGAITANGNDLKNGYYLLGGALLGIILTGGIFFVNGPTWAQRMVNSGGLSDKEIYAKYSKMDREKNYEKRLAGYKERHELDESLRKAEKKGKK